MNKKYCSLCLVLAFLIAFTALGPIQTTHAYPTYYSFSVPQKVQQKSKWCWAACSVSVIEYFTNQTVSQNMFVLTVNGNTYNSGASTSGICYGLSMYCVSSTAIENKLAYATLKSQAYSNKPVICGRMKYVQDEYGIWVKESGHFMISCGYDSSNSQQLVVMMDPGYTSYQYRSYSSLSSLITEEARYFWELTIYQFS